MKQLFIIAVGVFLGMGALQLVQAVPGWIEAQQEDRARSAIFRLTPEDIIQKCGKPLNDKVEKVTDKVTYRTLSYEGSYKQIVLLSFGTYENAPFQNPSIDTDIGLLKNATHRRKLAELSCLTK